MEEEQVSMTALGEETVKVEKQTSKHKKGLCHSLKFWICLVVGLLLISMGLLIALIIVITQTSPATISMVDLDKNAKDLAEKGSYLFSGLSEAETKEVVDFLMKQNELDIVEGSRADLMSNYIYSIEDYIPEKKSVMDYLDGRTNEKPERQVRVIVFMGKASKVKDYLVGPVPAPRYKVERVTNQNGGQGLTWRSRPVCYVVEYKYAVGALHKLINSMKTLITESFTPGCVDPNQCLHFGIIVRNVLNSNHRHLFVDIQRVDQRIEDYYLYPVPFNVMLQVQDGSSEYQVVKIYYNRKEYENANDLMTEYENNLAIRYKIPDISKNIGSYGSPRYESNGERADQTIPPPVPVSVGGVRFAVQGQFVKWLDWSFNIHARLLTGMQLFDVRHSGVRIAYELGIEDILVIYGGNAPDNFIKSYFDVGLAAGRFNLPMIVNVDCPPGAVYLDANIYTIAGDKPLRMKNAMCIFEHRNSVPLRRHMSPGPKSDFQFAFSMPDTTLIVRQILTLWNYDYVIDYEFHQNGVIELKASSTGYIAATNNLDARDRRYGYIINPHWNAGGNVHHHLFNFKMDVDITGVENRFKTIDFAYDLINGSFTDSEYSVIKFEEKVVQTEKQALIRYDFNHPKYYVIYTENESIYKDSTSPLPVGYRVTSNGFSKQVLPENNPLVSGGASWTKYQLSVTKFKESERTTTSHFVNGDPYHPNINFDSFVYDDENIVDTDLVLWATVGLHHIPTYEDLPVTTTPGKTVGVTLQPFNYFERDPSIHSRDAAILWNREKFDFPDSYLKAETGKCPLASSTPEIKFF